MASFSSLCDGKSPDLGLSRYDLHLFVPFVVGIYPFGVIYIYTLVRYIYIYMENMCGNSLHLPIMPIKYLPVHLIYLHVVGLFVLHFYWLFTTCYFLEKKLPKDRTNAKSYYSET